MIDKQTRDILKQYWGFDDFREHQKPIISSICSGANTVGLLPTGGGKSICYQVPGMYYPGLTIVISPLVALMEDQHQGLVDKGIASYHFKGSYSPRKLDEAFRNLRYGSYKFAFFAPERLNNKLFCEYILHADISLIAVDEAHCISQWGFDFRPSYLNVQLLRELLPDTPVIALTASATERVKKDVLVQLHIADANVFEGSIRRSNLSIQKRFSPNKQRQLLRLMGRLTGTGIIYAKTRRNCEMLSNLLNAQGFSSCFYHAGVDDDTKKEHQRLWQSNSVKTMVATTAFGMGIDKGDVNWVIHWDAPDTVEGFYQEIGRAGRDGAQVHTYLLFHQYDLERLRRQLTEQPDIKKVEAFYRQWCSKNQIAVGAGEGHKVAFSLPELARQYELAIPTILQFIKLLQQRGLWQFHESDKAVGTLSFTSSVDQWDLLKVEDRELLTTLLRLYPSMLDGPRSFDERRFAAMVHQTLPDFRKTLGALQDRGLVEYEPERSGCALTLTQPRPENKHLTFPPSFVDSWITSKSDRINAMIQLLQADSCLVQFVETYFGQPKLEPCGSCSSCQFNHYPDQDKVNEMLDSGLALDDIWFDLNCSPDELRNA